MTDVEVAYALSAPFSAGVDTVRRSFDDCFGASDSHHPDRLQHVLNDIGNIAATCFQRAYTTIDREFFSRPNGVLMIL
jgi:hypothetical protein